MEAVLGSTRPPEEINWIWRIHKLASLGQDVRYIGCFVEWLKGKGVKTVAASSLRCLPRLDAGYRCSLLRIGCRDRVIHFKDVESCITVELLLSARLLRHGQNHGSLVLRIHGSLILRREDYR